MDLRTQVIQSIESQDAPRAKQTLRRLWSEKPNAANAAFVISSLQKLHGADAGEKCKIAVLRSFTLEPVMPLLQASIALYGIDADLSLGQFGQYAQDILNESSELYRFAPDVAILAVQTRDIAPELWDGFADLGAEEIAGVCARVAEQFRAWLQKFRSLSNAHIIVHGLELPSQVSHGILDAQTEQAQTSAILEINAQLRRCAREMRGVVFLDYDALIARHGRDRWTDERKWLIARMPISADLLIHLANEWVKYIAAIRGKICKALVVDLDNTLWHGIVGEDGLSGIKLDGEYPGAAHRNLQRVILDLQRRGIILALCSKNNHTDAWEVIEKHPGMLLRPENIAAHRINWNPKSQSVREIAHELNIGLDAIAFLDDSEVERAQIELDLPEVHVIDPGPDAFQMARRVQEFPLFARLTVSSEDKDRVQLYRTQQERAVLAGGCETIVDFYHSLQQEVSVARLSAQTLARAAQLTQKTNQFNLTTHRYSEQVLSDRSAADGWETFVVSVKDRFGDNGIVGVVVVRTQGESCEIDTFLMSCRVIGRSVETAMLSAVVANARARGARVLTGTFIPTKKNEPAKRFFDSHGFAPASSDDGTAEHWVLDLETKTVECPEWIKLAIPEGAYEHAASR